MKFIETPGNLLTSEIDAIGHCANCFCTMGSGIALQIKNKFPEAYTADLKTISGDKTKFGKFSKCRVSESTNIKYIYNLYGQYTYGRESRKLNYEMIYTALEAMKNDCVITSDITSVGFPKNMGCALAGGDWRIVREMIYSVFEKTPYTVMIVSYNS